MSHTDKSSKSWLTLNDDSDPVGDDLLENRLDIFEMDPDRKEQIASQPKSDFTHNLILLVEPGEDIEPSLNELDHPIEKPDQD